MPRRKCPAGTIRIKGKCKPEGKVTLEEHAEEWQRERGKRVPKRGTKAHDKMYDEWINYAFK